MSTSTADTGAPPTTPTASTADTGPEVEPIDVCGRAVAPAGPIAGRRLSDVVSSGEAWWTVSGSRADVQLGKNGGVGDLDGDGVPDLAVTYGDIDLGLTIFFGELPPGPWDEPDVAAYMITTSIPGGIPYEFGVTDVDADGTSELLFNSRDTGVWEVLDPAPGPSGTIETSALVSQATLLVSTWDGGWVQTMHWSRGGDVDLDGEADLWLTTFDGAIADPYLKLLPGPIVGPRDPLLESIAVYDLEREVDHPSGLPDLDAHAVGNLDGDGVPDLAFGGWVIDGDLGRVTWVLDPPLVQAPIDDVLTSRVEGSAPGRELSTSTGVVLVPDMDGDGYDETAFSAEADYSPGGVAFLQYGPPPVGTFGEECLSVTLDADADSSATNEILPGDVDGDGTTDLVVHGGYTYLYYGPIPTGVWPIGELADALLPGGESLPLGVADFDGDGADDVVLGDFLDGGDDRGSVYVLLGGFE